MGEIILPRNDVTQISGGRRWRGYATFRHHHPAGTRDLGCRWFPLSVSVKFCRGRFLGMGIAFGKIRLIYLFVKRVFALFACFLATLAAGFADLRLLPADSCGLLDSCCCSDPATVDPCLCDDHSDTESQEMAAFVGLQNLVAPPAGILLVGENAQLANLDPRWHPALPWHAPPQEKRSRLAVWIL